AHPVPRHRRGDHRQPAGPRQLYAVRVELGADSVLLSGRGDADPRRGAAQPGGHPGGARRRQRRPRQVRRGAEPAHRLPGAAGGHTARHRPGDPGGDLPAAAFRAVRDGTAVGGRPAPRPRRRRLARLPLLAGIPVLGAKREPQRPTRPRTTPGAGVPGRLLLREATMPIRLDAVLVAGVALVCACSPDDTAPVSPVTQVGRLRFVHAVPDTAKAKTVNVRIDGMPLAANVAYKGVAGYVLAMAGDRQVAVRRTSDTSIVVLDQTVTVAAGGAPWQVRFTTPGDTTLLLAVPALTPAAGQVRTLLALDAASGGTPLTSATLTDR